MRAHARVAEAGIQRAIGVDSDEADLPVGAEVVCFPGHEDLAAGEGQERPPGREGGDEGGVRAEPSERRRTRLRVGSEPVPAGERPGDQCPALGEGGDVGGVAGVPRVGPPGMTVTSSPGPVPGSKPGSTVPSARRRATPWRGVPW